MNERLHELSIRQMQPYEADLAASFTLNEGWATETRAEFDGFLSFAPTGCLIALMGAETVGVCVATPYGEVGFIGELIVAPLHRGRGIGARLLSRAIEYLKQTGAQSIFLDGVQQAVALYERAGFRKVSPSLRFQGMVPGRRHDSVRPMTMRDLPAVVALDRDVFGTDRGFFLQRRLEVYPELAWVLEREHRLSAFILGRRGPQWAAAGPWVVQVGEAHPEYLLESLACQTGGLPLLVGVLARSGAAVALLRSRGFEERPSPPWRMCWGRESTVGLSDRLYAIGTAANG